MNFRQRVRTVDTTDFYVKTIEPKLLKAQYNPERFRLWRSLHRGPIDKVLHMICSPHYRFLMDRESQIYYQLQRKFGRNDKWIKNKIRKFLDTYDSISKHGILERVSALERPLVTNKHNKGYEIYEGHHRVAIALALRLKNIECEIIRRP